MASVRVKGFTNFLLLFNPVAAAMEYGYIGPTPTLFDLVEVQSMAPRPTRPPSMDEINGELRKRQLPDSIYSLIPKSWCGFINGDFDNPFSCASKTCVLASEDLYTSLACSPYDDGESIVYISCLDSTDYVAMPTFPSYDTTVCTYTSSPYCGKGALPRGEYYFFCDSTTLRSITSLEYLQDWYATGSIPKPSISIMITITDIHDSTSTTTLPSISTTTTTTDIHDSTSTTTFITDSPTTSSNRRLAAPAIAGIVVAIGAVVIGAITGLGICLFLRRRKRKESINQPAAIPTEPSNPQMQQGDLGQGWQIVAPVSSSYPNSQNAFLQDPEHPSPQGSGTSQIQPYHEMSSGFAPPTRQSRGTQSLLPLNPIHEAPQANYNENQAHGVLPSATNRPSGSGAYHEAAHPPREISAGVGGSHSYSNSISSNTGRPPQNYMDSPIPISPAVVAPTLHINSETYEGQQQAQYNIHEAPETMHYTAYSPEMSPVTSSPLDVYHNNNAQ